MIEQVEPPRSTEHVQSLVRGLAVIRTFDAQHPALTLSEVARRAELSRATARRVLHTLVGLGYMSTDGRLFRLRPRILELGYAYLSTLELPGVAQPHLEALTHRVNESCSVSVLDGPEIVYVARVAMQRIMTVAISVGTRFPAYATSMGRVLLAFRSDEWLNGFLASNPLRPLTAHTITDPNVLRRELETIRRQGWALVDQELEEGLRSIAAPIRDPAGEVVAAVNVSASARRGSAQQVRDDLLPALLETAGHISADVQVGRPRLG